MNILPTQRHLFEIPDEIAYFNCAYYSPSLNESTRRMQDGVLSKCRPWEQTINDFFQDTEDLRMLAADLFGGDSDGYAITSSASYGINTATRMLEAELNAQDEILIIEEEFPSLVLALRRMAKETGAKITTVDKPVEGNWTTAILESIKTRTSVVAISSCHWTDGSYIDLVEVSKACIENEVILIIDTTQSLGAVPFSIDEVKPDFMVNAGYKWLLGPYGFSLLYLAPKWRNHRPLEETWIGRSNARDFKNLVEYSDEYLNGARRFDVGQTCRPTILPGAIAALEQIKSWGIHNIANTLQSINNKIADDLVEYGFGVAPSVQRCPHILGVKLPMNFAGDFVTELKSRNIFISQRGRSLRFAPHLYINDHDIHNLKKGIHAVLSKT